MTDLTKLICDLLSSGSIVAEVSEERFKNAATHVKTLCETYLPDNCSANYDAIAEHLEGIRCAQFEARAFHSDESIDQNRFIQLLKEDPLKLAHLLGFPCKDRDDLRNAYDNICEIARKRGIIVDRMNLYPRMFKSLCDSLM